MCFIDSWVTYMGRRSTSQRCCRRKVLGSFATRVVRCDEGLVGVLVDVFVDGRLFDLVIRALEAPRGILLASLRGSEFLQALPFVAHIALNLVNISARTNTAPDLLLGVVERLHVHFQIINLLVRVLGIVLILLAETASDFLRYHGGGFQEW